MTISAPRQLNAGLADPAGRWLMAALLVNVLVSGTTALWLYSTGLPPSRAIAATSAGFAVNATRGSNGVDSWAAMLVAYEGRARNPAASLYEPFFKNSVKFQYPPSSLLVIDVLPGWMRETVPDETTSLGRKPVGRLRALAGAASLLTTLTLIGVSILIFELSARRSGQALVARAATVRRVIVGVLLGAMFYPLVQGHSLGQIQIYINTLAGLAILATLLERQGVAGVLLGVCCLAKPQFGVILIWAIVRRNWRLATGIAAIGAIGLTAGLVRYGWRDHIDYVKVLRTISEHGEVYWPNQSVNGLLHRFRENGDPISFRALEYAPVDPVVNTATVVSSLLLLGLAFWPIRGGRTSNHDAMDLLAMIVAATMAAPVAWEHHYGVLLPVFAAAVPRILQLRRFGNLSGPLMLGAFALAANVVLRPGLLHSNRWLGIVGSHIFFGSLLLFALLLTARAIHERTSPPLATAS